MKRTSRKYSIQIDTAKTNGLNKRLIERLSQRIVGQSRAIQHIAKLMVSSENRLRDPSRPIGTMIFAGPSGVGKSFAAKELARARFGLIEGFAYPLTVIQCPNLAESHQISTLIGSPPGYVDSQKIPLLHRFNIERHGLISFLEQEILLCKDAKQRQEKQNVLEQVRRCLRAVRVGKAFIKCDKQSLDVYGFLDEVFERAQPLTSIVLFDEIERAHPNVWGLLLSIMEEGQLQLANNNETTSFANSLVLLTTNTGSREIQGVFGINKTGFRTPARNEDPETLDKAVHNEARRALEKIFPPALMGRLGKKIIAFRSLRGEDYDKIFRQLVEEFKWRLDMYGISLKYTPKFMKFVVEEGFSQNYGARILRDSVEDHVETPIASALSSGELKPGDNVLLTLENGQPVLRRQPRLYSQKDRPAEKKTEKETQVELESNGHNEEQSGALV